MAALGGKLCPDRPTKFSGERNAPDLLPRSSALVIYVNTQVTSLYRLPSDRYAVPANAAITLIGMVADAAYVARGAQGGA